MGAQCCLLAGLAVLANAGAGQRELEKTCNKIQAGPCKLLTNHKTTLPHKCGLDGEGKVKDPSSVLVLSGMEGMRLLGKCPCCWLLTAHLHCLQK